MLADERMATKCSISQDIETFNVTISHIDLYFLKDTCSFAYRLNCANVPCMKKTAGKTEGEELIELELDSLACETFGSGVSMPPHPCSSDFK